MAIKIDTSGFPDENVSDQVKESPEFVLAYMKAMYKNWWGGGYGGAFIGNTTTSGYDMLRLRFQTARGYWVGLQDQNQYKRPFAIQKGGDGKGGSGSTTVNIPWGINKKIKKYANLVQRALNSRPSNIEVNALDQGSKDERITKKAQMAASIEMAPELGMAYGMMGAKHMGAGPGKPRTMAQLDLYDYAGGIKPGVAMLTEAVVRAVFNENRFDERIRERITQEDVAPCGITVVAVSLDSNGRPKITKHIPEDAIFDPMVVNTDKEKHRGVVHGMQLSQVKELAGDQFTDQQYEDMLVFARAAGSNVLPYPGSTGNGYVTAGRPFEIPVLEAYFYTDMHITRRARRNAEGKERLDSKTKDGLPVGSDWKPVNDVKESVVRTRYRCVMQGYWIIGSDFIFNAGKMPNQPMMSVGSAELPIVIELPEIYDGRWSSMAESVISILDAYQASWLRMLNIASRNGPAGLAFHEQAIAAAVTDGGYGSPAELLERFRQSGLLPIGEPDNHEKYGGALPVMPLDISQRSPIETELLTQQALAAELDGQLAFNQATNATNADPKMLVGALQMAMVATDNALWVYKRCVDRVVEGVARRAFACALRGVEHEEWIEGWVNLIGQEDTNRLVELARDNTCLSQLGIEVAERLDTDQRQQLYNAANAALEARMTSGKGGIELSDWIMIVQDADSMKGFYRLVQAQDRIKQEDAAMEQQMSEQRQAEGQASMEQQMALMQQKIAIEVEAKIREKLSVIQAQDEANQNKAARDAAMADALADNNGRIDMILKKMDEDRALAIEREKGAQQRQTAFVEARLNPEPVASPK